MTTEIKTPAVGDILVESWGYDQTNIDYYQVVAVTKASVRIRKIQHKLVANEGASETVAPDVGKFEVETGTGNSRSDTMTEKGATRRFKNAGGGYGYCVRITDYSHAYLWKGQPNRQTAAGYGH